MKDSTLTQLDYWFNQVCMCERDVANDSSEKKTKALRRAKTEYAIYRDLLCFRYRIAKGE